MAEDVADRRRRGELALRVTSSLVLIPFALGVVYAGGWWLAAGAALFAGVMAFEWCRMAGQGPVWLAVAGVAGVNLAFEIIGAAEVCFALAGFALAFGLLHGRRFALAAFGVVYAGGLPFALQLLREGGPWEGQAAALILMAIVWASDSGAYFAGRGFGGPSLSVDSPNKTWSGAIGGIVCAVLSGAIAAGLLGAGLALWMVFGAAVSACAQAGDLFESQIKRRFGVKDASGLVPGHGGVMDRVDGLGAVCLLAVGTFLVSPGLVTALGFEGR